MRDSVWLLLCAFVCGVSASNCATVVNGPTQKIGISSTPLGAAVVINDQMRVLTPASVPLARDQSHTFVFKKVRISRRLVCRY
jgi:hypothetical protein